MSKNQKTKVIPFDQVIAALLDNKKPFSPTYLHRFSDLNDGDVKELKNIWSKIEKDRKAALMVDLEELNNHDTLVCFDAISQIAINDPDPKVRACGITLLWECDDDGLVPRFIQMMQHDPDEVVRATAASALGMFVYLGELEEIPEKLLKQVETVLLEVMNSKDSPLVKRRVLEALGSSSRQEVPELLEKAYNMEDEQWQSSALFAMGRSADNRWEKHVLDRLDARDEILFEAARAAGELELEAAREPLLDMLQKEDEELDEDLRDAIIWSLSKIGGEDVRDVLEKMMDETEDEEELEFIQNALDNLDFTESSAPILGMLDFQPKIEEEGLDFIIDLEHDENDLDEDDLLDLGPSKN